MATRSAIAYYTEDQRIRAIYCHFDGYLECNGKILKECWNDWTKVESLVERGDISSLGETLEETEFYTQRGEELCIYEFENEYEYAKEMFDMGCEFLYLYVHDMSYDKEDAHWHYCTPELPEFSPVY
jgi:hypothetical protein